MERYQPEKCEKTPEPHVVEDHDSHGVEEYEPHPLALQFPPMPPDELDRLTDDIRRNGLIEPLTLFEGKILDGTERLTACRRAGVKPRTQPLPEGVDPLSYVISKNRFRKHYTTGQRAMMAARMTTTTHGGDRRSQDQTAKLHLDITVEKAAKLWGVSTRYVQTARAILQHYPKLAQLVWEGSMSLLNADALGLAANRGQDIDFDQPPADLATRAEYTRFKELERKRNRKRKDTLTRDELLGRRVVKVVRLALKKEAVPLTGFRTEVDNIARFYTEDGRQNTVRMKPEERSHVLQSVHEELTKAQEGLCDAIEYIYSKMQSSTDHLHPDVGESDEEESDE